MQAATCDRVVIFTLGFHPLRKNYIIFCPKLYKIMKIRIPRQQNLGSLQNSKLKLISYYRVSKKC